ncbi:hypothetical protein AB0G92_34385 [Streptomyces californicus]|nr:MULTISPECIES: hypothetical protein [unclassified Streptomyces]
MSAELEAQPHGRLATKRRWQLTADDHEFEALMVFAERPCEDTIVRYTPVA